MFYKNFCDVGLVCDILLNKEGELQGNVTI